MGSVGGAPTGGKSFGDIVRTHRGVRSVRDVAQAAGLSPATLLHLERGTTLPRLETVLALADALGVPAPELVAELLAEDSVGPHPATSFGPDSDIVAAWTGVAEALLDELDRRRADDALRFVDHAVLTELMRLCITRVSPTTLILLSRKGTAVKLLVLHDSGTEMEVTPILLSAAPDPEDLVALRAHVKAVDWSAPGRAFFVFVSWAPDATLRLADSAFSGLRGAQPGTLVVSQSGEAYCVVHRERAGVRVIVASVGLDVTAPRADVRQGNAVPSLGRRSGA